MNRVYQIINLTIISEFRNLYELFCPGVYVFEERLKIDQCQIYLFPASLDISDIWNRKEVAFLQIAE